MKKPLFVLTSFSLLMASCNSSQTPEAIHFSQNAVPPLSKAFNGTWGKASAGTELATESAAKLFHQFQINVLKIKKEAQQATVNYVALYLNKINSEEFQEDWGAIITRDSQTGEYYIEKGQEKAFEQRAKDWATATNAAFNYPNIVFYLDSPMRNAYQISFKYCQIVDLLNKIEQKISQSSTVLASKNSYTQKAQDLIHRIGTNKVLYQEAVKNGLGEQETVDLQLISDKIGNIDGFLANLREAGGGLGRLVKGTINWIAGDDYHIRETPEEREKLVKTFMDEVSQKTGVTNDKALRYYVEHRFFPDKPSSALLREMDPIGPAKGYLQSVNMTKAYDEWKNVAGKAYQDLGLVPQNEWSALSFPDETTRKSTFRQVAANINATYSKDSGMKPKVISGDWDEFKKVNPENIESLAYNPILSEEGQGVWQFGYKDGDETKYITVQMPFNQIGSALPYKGQNIPLVDRKIVRYMSVSSKNFGSDRAIEAIPFIYDKSRTGVLVRFTYSFIYNNSTFSINIERNEQGKRDTIALTNTTTKEVIRSNNLEDLLIALYNQGTDVDHWEKQFEGQ